MAAPLLTPQAIAMLLEPYIGAEYVRPDLYTQLQSYLDVILKWNSRLNLTSIREPEQIVRRHFGESLFAGLRLGSCDSLLDLGSGAGFPGIPIQLLRPELPVTLAESRARKAAFLHEVIRTLNLGTEVWAHRAETMPANRGFHTVALRAVDEMDLAIAEAARRAEDRILILGTIGANYPTLPNRFPLKEPIAMPNTSEGVLWIAEKIQSSAGI
jgi:16S rRNA (guanine527-N7)-methyltransferase